MRGKKRHYGFLARSQISALYTSVAIILACFVLLYQQIGVESACVKNNT